MTKVRRRVAAVRDAVKKTGLTPPGGVDAGDLGKIFNIMKKHKIATGLGLLFLAQLFVNKWIQQGGEISRLGIEKRHLEAMSPEDAYYQAMLPELMQERKAAKLALLQALLQPEAGGSIPLGRGDRLIGSL